jgi:hypothetical protein
MKATSEAGTIFLFGDGMHLRIVLFILQEKKTAMRIASLSTLK